MSMKHAGPKVVASALLFLATAVHAQQTQFQMSYKTASMNKALLINGYEPSAAGTYPAFIYITGTKLSPWSADDQLITQEMAARGFVAVAVDYTTRMNYPANCTGLTTAVAQVFDASNPASAVNVVASRAKVDLSKGLVVMGFSQGANVASLAKNFSPSIAGAVLIGNGYTSWGASCYGDGYTAITGSQTRSLMGATDSAYVFNGGPGGNIEQNRIVMETTSGMSCGLSATSCTDAGGGGWYLVQAFETASGKDGHCFHYGNSPCGGTPMDAQFVSGSHYWSLGPSLDWLAAFGTP
jgi:hypothetical protein